MPTSWIETAFPQRPLENVPAFLSNETTLSDLIVRGVRHALFAGVLNPGDHIGTEASIAEAVGVSRMAARDALRALVTQGIVTVRKGTAGGARIAHGDSTPFSDALAVQLRLMGVDLGDLLEAQISLEATAAELVAASAGPAEVAELRACLARAADHTQSTGEFMREISEFHLTLARLSNNQVVGSLLRSILQVLHDCYGRNTTIERAHSVLRSYEALTHAIEANDPEAARVLMRSHLRRVKGELLESERLGERDGTTAA